MRYVAVAALAVLVPCSPARACDETGIRPGVKPIASPPLAVAPDAGFGVRQHPILNVRRQHDGLDYPAATGTPVAAAMTGRVIEARYAGAYGNSVRLRHGGDVETVYAHLSRFAAGLAPGDCIARGSIIGHVGSTGVSASPHLHFELRIHGMPVDPTAYLADTPPAAR